MTSQTKRSVAPPRLIDVPNTYCGHPVRTMKSKNFDSTPNITAVFGEEELNHTG